MSESVNILGIPVAKLTFQEALNELGRLLDGNEAKQISTLNAEFALATGKDPDFKKAILGATLVLPDGIGILWAAKYLSLKRRNISTFFLSLSAILFRPSWIKTILPEKISGADLFWPLMKLAAEKNKKVFLLGAAPGVAYEVHKLALQKQPSLKVVGTSAASPKQQEEASLVERINASEADLLFVAYNFREQEKWIQRNLKKLRTVKVAIGIGGTLDFMVGGKAIGKSFKARRAPALLRKLGLEWFWRFLTQPYRWKRIWDAVGRFSWSVYKYDRN